MRSDHRSATFSYSPLDADVNYRDPYAATEIVDPPAFSGMAKSAKFPRVSDVSELSSPGTIRFDNPFTKSRHRTIDMLAGTRHRGWRVKNTMLNGLNPGSLGAPTPRVAPGRLSVLPVPGRKRDRAGKQRALMLAALHLFATKGYEATTTREIAAAAGCAEGLIHRYFKGKAGLLPALVEYQISQEQAEMRPPSVGSLEEDFLQLVDWEITQLWEKRDFLRVFISRGLLDSSVAHLLDRAVLSSRTAAVTEWLRHRPGADLSAEEVEVLASSVGVFGMMFGFLRPMALGQDRIRARKAANTLASILIRGLQHAQTK